MALVKGMNNIGTLKTIDTPNNISDHRAITTQIKINQPTQDTRGGIPIKQRRNPTYTLAAVDIYERKLPEITKLATKCKSKKELENC